MTGGDPQDLQDQPRTHRTDPKDAEDPNDFSGENSAPISSPLPFHGTALLAAEGVAILVKATSWTAKGEGPEEH